MKFRYSVIIPTLNAANHITRCISSIKSANGHVQIIVVDGGSKDRTCLLAKEEDVQVIYSNRGRGIQLNTGARAANGDIFLFLHADTAISKDVFCTLDKFFNENSIQIGTFTMKFDQSHWLLSIYSLMTRIDSLFTSFGDQCIVVRRTFFETIGGFPNWPLFEDVRFLQEARKRTIIHSFPCEVITSAEKFSRNGMFRHQFRNALLILQYLMGVSPEHLYKKYSA